MKSKGLILIMAGIFVILAGIAIYGYVGVQEAGTASAAIQSDIDSLTPATFDAHYDMLVKEGKSTSLIAGNSELLNFFIRYRLIFLIAAAVSLVGGAAVCLLPGTRKRA